MIILWLQSLGLLLVTFLISGIIGWCLAPRPRPKKRRISLFDEASDKSDFSDLDTPFEAVRVPETADAPAPQPSQPVAETIDRTSRPERSVLADMTPEALERSLRETGESLEPLRLPAPEGEADDLKLISGIGAVNENELNSLGIFHYWQIASWLPGHVLWLNAHLSFAARIVRENWISQADRLAQRVA